MSIKLSRNSVACNGIALHYFCVMCNTSISRSSLEAEIGWMCTDASTQFVPPCVDVCSTLQDPGAIVTCWDESTRNDKGRTCMEKFEHVMTQCSSVMKGVFSGHTYMDYFRLISDLDGDARVSAFVHVTPAISPRSGNNSAFEVLRCRCEGTEILMEFLR